MRAKEFLKELFAPGKKWQWSFTGSEEAVAVFHVGDIPYQFHAYTYADENPTAWEVEFKNATRGQSGRSTKFGLTGTGNSAEVMSTIADIMREFLQRYQGSISELTFTADEPSRRALYTRMAKRLLPAWEIVQSGKNFTLVAPETVNENTSEPQAAGCIIVAEDTGRWCLQQRSDTVSDPGVWSTWGGGREPGETLEQTVRRELAEEGGYTGPLKLEPLMMNQRYATYIGHVPHEFEPRLNSESQDSCWVEAGDWPSPMHPGVAAALQNISLNENFADGKVKGKSRPGRVKRAGASCNGSVTDLRRRAKNASGERAKMYHWCANMKSGRKK
jgi:8-oxo-dGTP pyrophosphatase MutT (NUDIX family)